MPTARVSKPSPAPQLPQAWNALANSKDHAIYAAWQAVHHGVSMRRLKHEIARLALLRHGTIAEAARKLGLTRGGLRYLLRTAKRK